MSPNPLGTTGISAGEKPNFRGTAISAPPKPIEVIGSLLPDQLKWKIFFSRQAKNPKYLHHGDVVEATVATDDGAIDLGAQHTVVKYT